MQRIFISSFRPLLKGLNGRGSVAPMLAMTRSIQVSPLEMNKKGSTPGKITPKMAKLQKQYQEQNDKPVFLKGGPMDNILYRLTLVLCAIGLVGDLALYAGYIIP